MGTLCALALTLWGTAHAQASWNLEQCIEHALQNNIQIQKNRISEEKGDVTLWKNQGALFPRAWDTDPLRLEPTSYRTGR